MVGLLDFFTGGDPEQMAQIDPRYGVPRSDVRDAAVNTLGNISALLLAAGQPITPAQRAQLIAQIGPAAAGGGTDLYNAAQRRLMTAQMEQRRSEAEETRRIAELMRDPAAFRAATGQDLSQFAGMRAQDVSQTLRQIAVARATQDPNQRALTALQVEAARRDAEMDPVREVNGVLYRYDRNARSWTPVTPRRDREVAGPVVNNYPTLLNLDTGTFRLATENPPGTPEPAAPIPPPVTPPTARPVAPAAPEAPAVTPGAPIDLRRQPTSEAAPAPAPLAGPMTLAGLQEQQLRRALDQRRGEQRVGREDQPGRVEEAGQTAEAQARARLTVEQEEDERRRQRGRESVEAVLRRMAEQYQILDELGGIPSERRSAGANIGAFLSATAPGQLGGQALATPSQSARNVVESLRNQLITAIKNATGMSAQEMNSNVELQRLLAGVSGTTQSIESVRGILRNLSQQYGLRELNFPETPAPTPTPSREQAPRRGAQPTPNVRPTLEQFLNAARRDNPGVSDSVLTDYYNRTYGGR